MKADKINSRPQGVIILAAILVIHVFFKYPVIEMFPFVNE